MREETIKAFNTTCNCPTPCGHTDIEEFGNMSTDSNMVKCNNSTTVKRRSTNQRLSYDMDGRLNPRTRRSNQLDSTTNSADILALCTCQQSRSYPFCDNTHIAFNKETNSSLSPLYVTIVEDPPNPCSTCHNNDAKGRYGEAKDTTIDDKDTGKANFETEPPIVDNIAESLYSVPPREGLPIPTPPCTEYTTTTDPTPSTSVYIPSSIKDKINQSNVFTEEEVSQHHSRDSLWMVIKGNVYDITAYVTTHPGGERALLKFAGRDGTENVQFHSSKMLEILNSRYFIGKLYTEAAPSRCTIS
jgi:cytochrome b involved in lipid metabolism/CDGSH-type Zn-finger protein